MRIKPIDISILGSPWRIVSKTPQEDERLKDISGLTDFSCREIVLADMCQGEYDIADPHSEMQRTIRHEIVHAFFAESGLWVNSSQVSNWAMNEEMVDWIALQLPKMHAAMAQANALPGMQLVMD